MLFSIDTNERDQRLAYQLKYISRPASIFKYRKMNEYAFNPFHLFLSGLIKAKDWAYEKEWRLLFNNKLVVSDQAYYMGKPKTVYLGINIDPRHEKMIAEICKRKQTPVKKMKQIKNRFKLEPES